MMGIERGEPNKEVRDEGDGREHRKGKTRWGCRKGMLRQRWGRVCRERGRQRQRWRRDCHLQPWADTSTK